MPLEFFCPLLFPFFPLHHCNNLHHTSLCYVPPSVCNPFCLALFFAGTKYNSSSMFPYGLLFLLAFLFLRHCKTLSLRESSLSPTSFSFPVQGLMDECTRFLGCPFLLLSLHYHTLILFLHNRGEPTRPPLSRRGSRASSLSPFRLLL